METTGVAEVDGFDVEAAGGVEVDGFDVLADDAEAGVDVVAADGVDTGVDVDAAGWADSASPPVCVSSFGELGVISCTREYKRSLGAGRGVFGVGLLACVGRRPWSVEAVPNDPGLGKALIRGMTLPALKLPGSSGVCEPPPEDWRGNVISTRDQALASLAARGARCNKLSEFSKRA